MTKPLTDPRTFSRRIVVDSIRKLEKELTDNGMPAEDVQTRVKEIAEKCGCDYYGVAPMYVEPYVPLGGATSFEAAEAYIEGREWQAKLDDLSWNLRSIMDNILSSKEMTPGEVGLAIAKVATEFDSRVASFIDREGADTPDDEDEESDAAAAAAALLGLREGGASASVLAGDTHDTKETVLPLKGRKAGKRMANDKVGLLKQVQEGIGKLLTWGQYMENDPDANAERKDELASDTGVPPVDEGGTKDLGSFTAFKDTNGAWRWFAIYSNSYFDREGQAFQEKAHKEFVEHVDATQEFPALWLWHQPIPAGQADWLDFADGLAMASGTFNKGYEDVAQNLAAQKDLGVSHGYHYGKKDLQADGTFAHYRTFEISPLPGYKAANELTLFLPSINEEDTMALTKEKKDWLTGVAGAERVGKLEAALGDMRAAAKEKGIEVSYKELASAFSDETPSAAVAASVPVPSEPDAADGARALKAISDLLDAKLAPVLAQVKELQEAQDDLFMPRAASVMGAGRPSQDASNIVSGPRGGAETVASKELGLKDAITEANLQMAMKEDGIPDSIPAHLRPYAAMGMFGNIRQPVETA